MVYAVCPVTEHTNFFQFSKESNMNRVTGVRAINVYNFYTELGRGGKGKAQNVMKKGKQLFFIEYNLFVL